MKAAILRAPFDLRIEEVPVPTVGTHDVLIAPRSVGICGTDISVYKGEFSIARPLVLGHELAGVVTEVGSEVARLKVGDRVTVEPSWGCEQCLYCQKGWTLHCMKKSSMGRTVDGALAEFVRVPERVVYQIGDEVAFDEAQATSTIASALRAMSRLGPWLGTSTAVLGSGHGGLILLQLCRLAGVRTVVVVGGSREHRLRVAEQLGADLTVRAGSPRSVDTVLGATGGLGVDSAIEASGVPDSVILAMELVRRGGTVMLFGIYEVPAETFPLADMYNKELTLIGSKGGFENYPHAIALLNARKIQLAPLISHNLPLDEVGTGIRIVSGRDDNALRVVIKQ
ncbi:MAG: alcohol dehydrogenase catalytic domain-containing protein [Ardenticatenaceae bacterium]|nr:alcohol dehydrogenase catalytic domain-containing protein [Ardenticatenaceae bacterium]